MQNNLITDELPAELAKQVAFVAGHDDESKPVLRVFTLLRFGFLENILVFC